MDTDKKFILMDTLTMHRAGDGTQPRDNDAVTPQEDTDVQVTCRILPR